MHRRPLKALFAMIALVAIAVAWCRLLETRAGLVIERVELGRIPVTIFRPSSGEPAPVVVIAHGFAGSQPLMQPFAQTFARNGYIAVTFDFPGHGRNPLPLSGGFADMDLMNRQLLAALREVTRYAQQLPGTQGLAVLGHSMASDVVVRLAETESGVRATIAVSLFVPEDGHLPMPPNLLIIDGALEAAALVAQAHSLIDPSAGGQAEPSRTYGHFEDGSARRLVLARRVEHIGVLYSGHSLRESLAWLDTAFGRSSHGDIDERGRWLGLLLLGLIVLAWPLSALLPRVTSTAALACPALRDWLAVAVLPALLTPVLLWKLPTGFLPLLLGDYLALHFGLYGLLTLVGIAYLRRHTLPRARAATATGALLLAALAMIAYSLLSIGLALDSFVFAFLPGPRRWPMVAALAAGTLPYFVADESLTRRYAYGHGAYAATKVLFLLSLLFAVALNLEKLFFLVIIVPAILLLFGVYGLFSAWVFQRTRSPMVAAIANAVLFAWFIAVVFPMVDR
jgi:hypothetical protein